MNIYEGTENYIFVSYAHADSDKVIPILEALGQEGFRLWCNLGINVGAEWDTEIAIHIKKCDTMICFISKASSISVNCRNEISYAIEQKKELLVIHLEPAELPPSLGLQLSIYQAMFFYRYSDLHSFISNLRRTVLLQPCSSESIKKTPSYSNINYTYTPQKSDSVSDTDKNKSSYHQIFISYRRKGGDVVAKLICSELQNRGYSVFYDYDSLKGGYFDNHITDAIKHCNDFILVLPRRALARCRNKKDWVRQEIICALEGNKNIIPVMVDGFEFPKKLPAEISDVARCNGVRFDMAYLDAVIDKIIEKLST